MVVADAHPGHQKVASASSPVGRRVIATARDVEILAPPEAFRVQVLADNVVL